MCVCMRDEIGREPGGRGEVVSRRKRVKILDQSRFFQL